MSRAAFPCAGHNLEKLNSKRLGIGNQDARSTAISTARNIDCNYLQELDGTSGITVRAFSRESSWGWGNIGYR
jgi:hypothetical protein